MKHTDLNYEHSVSGSASKFRRRWRAVSALVITLWAVWALLDAFVIPRDIVAVEEAAAVPAETADTTPDEADGTTPDNTDGAMPDEADGATPDEAEGASPDDDAGPETGTGSEPEHGDPEYEAEHEMAEAAPAALAEPVITDSSYYDGFTRIEIDTMRMLDTNIYIANVDITDSSLLRTALANNTFGRNLTEPTSVIAERSGAIFAVNGDYYGFRDTGYVMRNGYLYRSVPAKDPDQEDLVLYEDGSIDILREADMTAEEMSAYGATDIFSFGPGLVMDGEITVSENDEVERAQVTNPRTAIGILSPLHYLFVVSDGRTDESTGLSLYELAVLMKDLGCKTAYNLDGGGSSTMWFNGRVLNNPTTFGDKIAERSVSDIVYIRK